MDLQNDLIESNRKSQKGGWQASLTALVLHGVLIAAILVASATTTHKIDAEDKPIPVFVTQGAAPPPPPPPPPPAMSASQPKATPRVTPKIEPQKPIPHDVLIPPQETPKEIPQVQTSPDITPSEDLPSSAPAGAVEGGVAGGVMGGVVGGEVGGVKGGEIGGVKGGELGGVLGGKVGGTGTGTEGEGTGGKEAPVEAPSGPLRVGGDVKAPVAIDREDPKYTETARKAKVTGVIVVEAIIDKHGHVDRVRVIKGLPMGLSQEAERAVRQWRFKPGTLNGEPVDVIFNLTVTFKLGEA